MVATDAADYCRAAGGIRFHLLVIHGRISGNMSALVLRAEIPSSSVRAVRLDLCGSLQVSEYRQPAHAELLCYQIICCRMERCGVDWREATTNLQQTFVWPADVASAGTA